jgi:phosphohistidine phosphatase
MAPQIWLLRHGEAVPHESKADDERELTARGERQAIAAGEGLARLGIEFSACYASPKVRALDTARLVCRALNIEPEVVESVRAGFDRDDALELLLAHGDDAPSWSSATSRTSPRSSTTSPGPGST